jgi:Asp/Glu/hydantoin racemase
VKAARIALIHALAESVVPSHAAFAEFWPEAYAYDLLDTSLAVDRETAGRLDDAMMERFQTLAGYAAGSRGRNGETAGILFTCSAFGPAIDAVKPRLSIPVLRPNESAFAAALRRGRRIGLVVSFAPSASSLERELQDMAEARNMTVAVQTVIVQGALAALKSGNGHAHDRLVAEAAATIAGNDAVVLGQFSLARAASALEASGFEGRVITTPGAAVATMRNLVSQGRLA